MFHCMFTKLHTELNLARCRHHLPCPSLNTASEYKPIVRWICVHQPGHGMPRCCPDGWRNVLSGCVCGGVSGGDEHLNQRAEWRWPSPRQVGTVPSTEGLEGTKGGSRGVGSLRELGCRLPLAPDSRAPGSQALALRWTTRPALLGLSLLNHMN